MNILNCTNFIKENVELLVLDAVIDENGILHNGENGTKLIKGSIERTSASTYSAIIGTNGVKYPAGIDKNGNLVCLRKGDNVLSDLEKDVAFNIDGSKPLPISYNIEGTIEIDGVSMWTRGLDYRSLLTILPTGWVNVKIDMELWKNVTRYSSQLGIGVGVSKLKSKLRDLESVNNRSIRNRKYTRKSIQREMSIIMLLHYINELKDSFDPSSAGFLFESFISGLIPDSKVLDDNGPYDVVDGKGNTYQMKLYNNLADYINIKGSSECDYHIISIKHADRILVYILDNIKESPNYIENYKTPKGAISMSKLKSKGEYYELELINLDEKIEHIAKGLKQTLDNLYNNLSEFQYNIETIVTGTNQKGELLGGDDFTFIENSAKENIIFMRGELNNLIGIISGRKGNI